MFFFNFFLLIAVIIINHKKADLRYRLFPFLPFKSVYISGLRPWLILSTLAVYHFIKLGTIFKDGFIRCCYRALSLWWSSPPYICPVHSWPSDPFLGRQKHQEARWIHGNHPPLPYEKVVLFFLCSFISEKSPWFRSSFFNCRILRYMDSFLLGAPLITVHFWSCRECSILWILKYLEVLKLKLRHHIVHGLSFDIFLTNLILVHHIISETLTFRRQPISQLNASYKILFRPWAWRHRRVYNEVSTHQVFRMI